MKSVLNIAGGKIFPYNTYKNLKFLVNLDGMYLNSSKIEKIIEDHESFEKNKILNINQDFTEHMCNFDIYEFLEKYHIKFDGIVMYRFLEHVPKVKILYFIYLLSTSIKLDGTFDIIVPDYKALAKRILSENVGNPNWEAEDIITTFELLNEKYDPHGSIWTEDRLKYYLELEGRFKVEKVLSNYEFDGRNIYLRAIGYRVK